MIVKEIYVGISYPYETGQFKYGKIEFSELIAVENDEDIEDIRENRFQFLLDKAKKQAYEINHVNFYAGIGKDDTPPEPPGPRKIRETPLSETETPRRRRTRTAGFFGDGREDPDHDMVF